MNAASPAERPESPLGKTDCEAQNPRPNKSIPRLNAVKITNPETLHQPSSTCAQNPLNPQADLNRTSRACRCKEQNLRPKSPNSNPKPKAAPKPYPLNHGPKPYRPYGNRPVSPHRPGLSCAGIAPQGTQRPGLGKSKEGFLLGFGALAFEGIRVDDGLGSWSLRFGTGTLETRRVRNSEQQEAG